MFTCWRVLVLHMKARGWQNCVFLAKRRTGCVWSMNGFDCYTTTLCTASTKRLFWGSDVVTWVLWRHLWRDLRRSTETWAQLASVQPPAPSCIQDECEFRSKELQIIRVESQTYATSALCSDIGEFSPACPLHKVSEMVTGVSFDQKPVWRGTVRRSAFSAHWDTLRLHTYRHMVIIHNNMMHTWAQIQSCLY